MVRCMEIDRKAKIKELKLNIAQAQEDYITDQSIKPEDKAKLLQVLEGLQEELRNTIMNKNSSSYFSFTPSPPNRKQRRAMGKMLLKRYKRFKK